MPVSPLAIDGRSSPAAYPGERLPVGVRPAVSNGCVRQVEGGPWADVSGRLWLSLEEALELKLLVVREDPLRHPGSAVLLRFGSLDSEPNGSRPAPSGGTGRRQLTSCDAVGERRPESHAGRRGSGARGQWAECILTLQRVQVGVQDGLGRSRVAPPEEAVHVPVEKPVRILAQTADDAPYEKPVSTRIEEPDERRRATRTGPAVQGDRRLSMRIPAGSP